MFGSIILAAPFVALFIWFIVLAIKNRNIPDLPKPELSSCESEYESAGSRYTSASYAHLPGNIFYTE
ncbi:hypothetical protein [Denitrovibrio acetiphilus]|uniref:hypothetical protein n=1 Tax=Denitrovibrio acetiphilus TaxID=118000 RepID=UPI00019B43C3|nr:hypothetical protein [Denitrovibrio acetiphilus]